MSVDEHVHRTSQPRVMDPMRDEVTYLRAMLKERDRRVEILEQQLEAANQRLETTEARLFELTDRDLYRLSVGVAAHNFNNMLTVILSHVQMSLADLERGRPSRTEIDDVLQAVFHARHLARRLIRWHDEDEPERLSANTTLSDLARMLRTVLPPEIEIRLVLDRSDPHIVAPPRALFDALLNVALNARDAMTIGAVMLTTKRTNGDVVLEIADDGTGMTPATRERIFEPYFTTKGDSGTGLGLSSVQTLFDRVEGHVEVESSEGSGTVFALHFPAADRDQNGY